MNGTAIANRLQNSFKIKDNNVYGSSYYWNFRTSSFKQVACLILCPEGVTYLHLDYCISERTLWKSVSANWSSTKLISSSYQYVTWSRHDTAENCLHGIKQQSLTQIVRYFKVIINIDNSVRFCINYLQTSKEINGMWRKNRCKYM